MTDNKPCRVDIVTSEDNIRSFCPMLTSGFMVRSPYGISVYELLSQIIGISDDYLENGIQTVLLDGKPVDDMMEHKLYAPSTVALSAALPGLFGAAFRKEGAFSALRRRYEGLRPEEEKNHDSIEVTVKLFNMVAGRVGPEILSKGIRIVKEDFLYFWQSRPERLFADAEIRINGTLENHSDISGKLNGASCSEDEILLRMQSRS